MADSVFIARRGKAWVAGIPQEGFSIPGVTDMTGVNSITESTSITRVDSTGSNGEIGLSVWVQKSKTLNVTLYYLKGEKPEVGDKVIITGDDGQKRAFTIETIEDEFTNTGAAAACRVTAFWSEGWQDDDQYSG